MDNDFLIPTSYNYAQIDEQGYCFAKSTLSGIVEHENMILIGEEDVQFGQKYDHENKMWLDEFKPEEPTKPILTLEDIKNDVGEVKEITTTTEGTVMMTSEDALTIMEYQTVLDEKLSKIITHLGV